MIADKNLVIYMIMEIIIIFKRNNRKEKKRSYASIVLHKAHLYLKQYVAAQYLTCTLNSFYLTFT